MKLTLQNLYIATALSAALFLSGCASNHPAPGFLKRAEPPVISKTGRRWGLVYRVCTNDYSILDLMPFRIAVNGLGELLIPCEE
ncbi:hypothetical protein [Vibrio ishigakensis]|uniref:hypothetical protein n=1 Tax=Vibrio ishigakensis TaxID=1481914 RepID=UPI0021C3AFA0|nr:hypothetical protein [Vibrio ishigakensis]